MHGPKNKKREHALTANPTHSSDYLSILKTKQS